MTYDVYIKLTLLELFYLLPFLLFVTYKEYVFFY